MMMFIDYDTLFNCIIMGHEVVSLVMDGLTVVIMAISAFLMAYVNQSTRTLISECYFFLFRCFYLSLDYDIFFFIPVDSPECELLMLNVVN